MISDYNYRSSIMYTFRDAYDQNYKINSRVRLLRPILSVFISSLSFLSREMRLISRKMKPSSRKTSFDN